MLAVLLNLGCGPVQPGDPWVNVDSDRQWTQPGMHVASPFPEGLPFHSDDFAGAVAHHVLQMVPWHELVPWLQEVRRVTAGPVRLSVPDIMEAVTARDGGDRAWFPIAPEHEPTVDGAFCMYVTQAGQTRSIFTAAYLVDLLGRSGFDEVRIEHYGVCEWLPALAVLDSRPNESLIVTAR